jgi:hypothetical protein
MGIVVGILVNLLKGYVIKLASKEFIEWVLLEIADAAVKATKTPHDDKWLAKIKEVIK